MRSKPNTRRFFVGKDRELPARSRIWFHLAAALFSLVAVSCAADKALADEDGISFWIPGFWGSLAATPQQPGWALTSILYNTNVSASGNAAVAREIRLGKFNP